jgi:hypothetical protein
VGVIESAPERGKITLKRFYLSARPLGLLRGGVAVREAGQISSFCPAR